MTTPYAEIVEHYEQCLEQYGDTHRGVDWPKQEDVDIRYRVMLDVVRTGAEKVSLLDFGCGAAHLYGFMLRKGLEHIAYSGLDISTKFVALSRAKYPDVQFYVCDLLEDCSALPGFDYVVMNGVFTEKRNLSFDEMWSYTQALLAAVFAKARIGIAFNVMSSHVDWERADLFHLPMDRLATFLKQSLSRHFVLRNDYGLYEYTAYVYRTPTLDQA